MKQRSDAVILSHPTYYDIWSTYETSMDVRKYYTSRWYASIPISCMHCIHYLLVIRLCFASSRPQAARSEATAISSSRFSKFISQFLPSFNLTITSLSSDSNTDFTVSLRKDPLFVQISHWPRPMMLEIRVCVNNINLIINKQLV